MLDIQDCLDYWGCQGYPDMWVSVVTKEAMVTGAPRDQRG